MHIGEDELYNPDVVVEHPMTGLKYMVANSGRRVGRRVDETASVEWTQIEPSAPSSNEATTQLIGKHYKELERGQTIRFSIVAPVAQLVPFSGEENWVSHCQRSPIDGRRGAARCVPD